MAEGQTATNPQTGERIVLRGGQWVPMGGGQSRASAPRPQQQRRPIQFSNDLDAVTRTLLGEAGNQGEQGMLAVGSVIANRARQRGLSPSQVVLERNQFEPWGNPETTNRLMGISPQSPEYQQAAAIAQRALAGEDPTGGASHFYAPRAQAALGRQKPSWDNGTGRPIGDHLFFNLDGQPVSVDEANFISAPMPADQPAIQTATNPQTGEKLQLVDGQWIPLPETSGIGDDVAVIQAGIRTKDGKTQLWDESTQRFYDATPEQVAEYEAQQRQTVEERRIRAERLADPEYQAAIADALRGAENVPDRLRALGLGGTLGFLTDINAEAQGALQGLENAGRRVTGQEIEYGADVARQAARDAMRDAQRAYEQEKPLENFGLQFAGGLLTPGVGQAGRYIESAEGLARLGRAAQVGAGYGAASGLGYGEGNLSERAPGVVSSSLVGAGAGTVGQGVLDRVVRGQAGGNASAARTLSRQGVNLTPAQMMTDIPALGPVARWTEQAASSIPVAGVAMRGAERRSIESFDRSVINRALESLDSQITTKSKGRAAIRDADEIVSSAYKEALDPVFIRPSDQINERIRAALNPTNLSRRARTTLQDAAADIQTRLGQGVTGQEWKQIDSELSGLINTTSSGDAASRPLSRALRDIREVVGDALEEASPGALERVRRADDAFGNMSLIRRAASNPTTGRNDELFTPSNLNSVLARSEGRAYGRGEARLQDLTDPAERVMAGTLNNSGTPERAALATVALGGAATGAFVNPTVAIPTIVGISALYSRPAQSALNAIYRATDSQAANVALRQLAQQAQENPALIPYYEAAAQHVFSLARSDTPTAQPAPQPAQAPSAALQRVMQP